MRLKFWLVFLGLTALAAAGCVKKPQQDGGMGGMMGGGPPPVAVVVEPVLLQDFAPAIELVGDIRASQRAILSAEVGGTITKIAHRVGEKHKTNDGPLFLIDPATYAAALDAARAQLASAEEGLKLAQNGARPQEIAAQEAAVQAAQAQFNLAQDNLRRQEELFAQGVVSESALVAARSQAEAAQAALDAQLEVLNQMNEGTREEDLARAKAAVDGAKAAVAQAEIALSKTAVAPPFDAVVTMLMVEVGTSVGPGSPLCEVVADGACEAWFNISETDVENIKPGAQVEVRLDALGGEMIPGTVISVSPSADTVTRQFPVRVAINDERAKPGMVANGRLLTAVPKPTLMISRNATVLSALGEVVFVMVPAEQPTAPPKEGEMPPLPSVNMVTIKTGEVVDSMVVVLEGGLTPGMMVVTKGNETLYQGAKIIPTNLMGQGDPGGAGGAAGQGQPESDAQPPAADPAAGDPGAAPGQTTDEANSSEPTK